MPFNPGVPPRLRVPKKRDNPLNLIWVMPAKGIQSTSWRGRTHFGFGLFVFGQMETFREKGHDNYEEFASERQ